MAAAITAAFGLVLRVLFLIQSAGDPLRTHLGLDMAGYDRWARAILAGRGLGEAPFTQAPLFPLLLSAAYAVLGPDPVRALWAHLLPGAVAVFLTALAAGRWKGPVAAWTAGLLVALYKPAIFYTGVLLPPAWVLAVAAVCVWLGMRHDPKRPARSTEALVGLAYGILALGQPAALLAVVPAVWFLADAGRRRRAAVLMLAGAALPLFLTLLYNGISGAWSPVAVNGGINLYIGNGPEANGAYVRPAGVREDRDLLGIAAAGGATVPGSAGPRSVDSGSAGPGSADPGGAAAARANASWTRRAIGFAATHPFRTAGLGARKLLLFFGQYEIPQVESLPFERRYAGLLRLPLPGMALLAAAGLLGFLLARRDRAARWLALSAAAVAVGVCVFFVTARFRMPAVPFLAVLAGGGAVESVSLFRSDRRRALLPVAAALAVCVLLTLNLSGIDARAGEGQYRFRLGVILESEGRAPEAMEEYREALTLDPSIGKAEVNLGALLARQGKLEEARAHLERGVALDPLSAVGFVNLGQIRQVQGRLEEALGFYESARRADPTSVSARENAALALYELGRVDEARPLFDEVSRAAPSGSPPALRARNLLTILAGRTGNGWKSSAALRQADIRFSQGDRQGASRLYNEALREPGAAEAAQAMLAGMGARATGEPRVSGGSSGAPAGVR